MRFSLLIVALIFLQDSPQREAETIVHRLGDLSWQHDSFSSGMAVLPGEKQVITASYNGTAVLWDIETGARLRTYSGGHDGEMMSLALLPGGKGFATGGMDGKVAIWDLEG